VLVPRKSNLIAQTQADLADAESAQASAEASYVFEASALESLRAEGQVIAGQLAGHERLREECQAQLDGLLALWSAQNLETPPSHSAFEAALGRVKGQRAAIDALVGERKRLAEALARKIHQAT
jgi:hypothetical protein